MFNADLQRNWLRSILGNATLVAIVAAAGCQSTPLPRSNVPISRPGETQTTALDPRQLWQQAQQRQRQGQGELAAQLYLQAAQGFLRQHNYPQAGASLQAITSTGHDLTRGNFAAGFYRSLATLALHERRFEDAQAALQQVLPSRDDNPDASRRVRAGICAAQQNWSCAASATMAIVDPTNNPVVIVQPAPPPVAVAEPEPVIAPAGAAIEDADANTQPPTAGLTPPAHAPLIDETLDPQQALHNLIWRYVNRTSLARAQQLANTANTPLEQGWWRLQLAAVSGFRGADQRQAVSQWQRQHGSHAAQFPWPTALQQLLQPSPELQRIALLLPLSGPLAAAGEAIRNGFVSAYLFDESAVTVEVFDSNAGPIEQTFAQIMQWQAQVVLGPLAKGNLDRINALNPSIPVLGLNYLAKHQPTSANLFQLGLAIEDEADTMIERLLADGHRNILVLHSGADWATRAAAQLSQQWPHGLTVEMFEDVRTVTEAVGRGMFVDSSQLRSQQIYRIIDSHIEFIPRARQDLDAIVAVMDNTQANALVPALKFHFAKGLPVYASAQAVRGAKPDKIRPLAGFRVSELPWNMLAGNLPNQVQSSFSLTGNSLSSLYALGADAYRVADRLGTLQVSTDLGMRGDTGILWVDEQRRFHRQQLWGVVSRGALVALPYVTHSASNNRSAGGH